MRMHSLEAACSLAGGSSHRLLYRIFISMQSLIAVSTKRKTASVYLTAAVRVFLSQINKFIRNTVTDIECFALILKLHLHHSFADFHDAAFTKGCMFDPHTAS